MIEASQKIEELLAASVHQLVFRSDVFCLELRRISEHAAHPLITAMIDDMLRTLPDSQDRIVETKGSRGVQNWLLDLWALMSQVVGDSLEREVEAEPTGV